MMMPNEQLVVGKEETVAIVTTLGQSLVEAIEITNGLYLKLLEGA